MKNLISISGKFLMIGIITLFTACEREAEHHDLTTADITLTINAPTASQEFEAGDTVKIKASISAPSEMHGYEVHLTRLVDNTEVLSKKYDVHANQFDVNEIFINEGLIHSDMELEIITKIDHNGKTTSKKVQFHCHEK